VDEFSQCLAVFTQYREYFVEACSSCIDVEKSLSNIEDQLMIYWC